MMSNIASALQDLQIVMTKRRRVSASHNSEGLWAERSRVSAALTVRNAVSRSIDTSRVVDRDRITR